MKSVYWMLFLLLGLCRVGDLQAQPAGLRRALEAYVADKPARIGVALVIGSKDTLCVNNDCRYPMMSVFKLHQAVAVAHWLRANGQSLDMPVVVRPEDLKPDTYSPLRERYPSGVALTVRDLLTYTLQQSDNNACDILFDRTCGVEETDRYLRSLCIGLFSIVTDEDGMHRDPELCYDNWSTPLAVARLLEWLFTHSTSAAGGEEAFIRQTLVACETGRDRLAAPLAGTGAVIGHKTGTSDRNAQGLWTGINDAGFVRLPDGRHYTLVVLVKDSAATFEATSRYIADISALVFEALGGMPSSGWGR